MPVVSMVGIAVIITIKTAAGRDSLVTIGHSIKEFRNARNETGEDEDKEEIE